MLTVYGAGKLSETIAWKNNNDYAEAIIFLFSCKDCKWYASKKELSGTNNFARPFKSLPRCAQPLLLSACASDRESGLLKNFCALLKSHRKHNQDNCVSRCCCCLQLPLLMATNLSVVFVYLH